MLVDRELHYKPFALYFSLTGGDTILPLLLKRSLYGENSLFLLRNIISRLLLMVFKSFGLCLLEFLDILEESSPSEQRNGAEFITDVLPGSDTQPQISFFVLFWGFFSS